MRLRTALETGLLLAAALLLGGCEQGREAPPKTRVQVVHAAPSFPAFEFLREQRSAVSELPYAGASAVLSFDADQYDFNVQFFTPAAAAPVRRSFAAEIVADTDYTFVLAEVGGNLEPVILETPVVEAGGQAQVSALHAGTTLPPVSVYLEPPGADLTTATPLAELSFLQSVTPAGRAAGEYQVTVTESGNPATVLLHSGTFTLAASQRAVLVVVDGAGEGAAPLKVVLAQDTPLTLIDQGVGSALRVVNGAADRAARDVGIAGAFSPPALAAVPFGAASAYVPIPAGESSADVTPAGNPGVVELTRTVSAIPGRSYTLLISGPPGTLDGAVLLDDRRRLVDRAQLALLNAASQFATLNFLLLEPGADPATAALVATLGSPGGAQYVGLVPGTYELVVRTPDGPTVATVPITVAAGGIYAGLTVNGPDAASAEMILLDDFTP